MKTRQMIKTVAWSAAVLALVLTVAACSGSGKDKASSASPSDTASGPVSSAESSAAGGTTSASPAASPTETKTATGDFVGLIDNHSVEIKVDGQSQAYQIDPETADKVSPWEEGTKVKFQYLEQTMDVDGQQIKQFTITVIDKA